MKEVPSRNYLATLEIATRRKAFSYKDKGGCSWEVIAKNLWDYYSANREQWPGPNEVPPSSDMFFSWVEDEVTKYETSMGLR
jgi:hypothetical protein